MSDQSKIQWNPKIEALAKMVFDTYCNAIFHATGAELPEWDEIDDDTKLAWVTVADVHEPKAVMCG